MPRLEDIYAAMRNSRGRREQRAAAAMANAPPVATASAPVGPPSTTETVNPWAVPSLSPYQVQDWGDPVTEHTRQMRAQMEAELPPKPDYEHDPLFLKTLLDGLEQGDASRARLFVQAPVFDVKAPEQAMVSGSGIPAAAFRANRRPLNVPIAYFDTAAT